MINQMIFGLNSPIYKKSPYVPGLHLSQPIRKASLKSINNDVFVRSSSINFTGSDTSNGDFLRELNGLTDPYSGVKMLTTKEIVKFSSELSLMNNSAEKIDLLSRYQENMFPVEKKIFKKLEKSISKNGKLSISQVLLNKRMNALENLSNEQIFVLDSISIEAKELNPKLSNKVSSLIKKTKRHVLNNEKSESFKRKSFIAKLVKLKEDDVLNDIENKLKTENKYLDRKLELKEVKTIRKIVDSKPFDANLRGSSPFKAVIELQKKYMPETIVDNKKFYKLYDLATCLPTSLSSSDAFIVKYSSKSRSDDEIAKRLVQESTVSIEHIRPKSLGGPNAASNFMAASRGRNTERGNMSFKEFLRIYPDIPKNSQKYVDDIIDAAHNHKINDHLWYPYLLKDTLKKEADIDVDISKYQISPQDAFKDFPVEHIDKYPKYHKFMPKKPEITENFENKHIDFIV